MSTYVDAKSQEVNGYNGKITYILGLQTVFSSRVHWMWVCDQKSPVWFCFLVQVASKDTAKASEVDLWVSTEPFFFFLKIHLMVCAVSLCNFLLFSSPVCCSKQCKSKIDLYLDYMDWRDPSKACSGLSGRLPSTGFSRHSSWPIQCK